MPRRLLPLVLLLAGCNLAGNPTRLQSPLHVNHHQQSPDPIEQADAEREVQKTWENAWEQLQREQRRGRSKPAVVAGVLEIPREHTSRRPLRRIPRRLALAISGADLPPRRFRERRVGLSQRPVLIRAAAIHARKAAIQARAKEIHPRGISERVEDLSPENRESGAQSGSMTEANSSGRSTISAGISSGPVRFTSDLGKRKNKGKNKGKVAGQVHFAPEVEDSVPEEPEGSTLSSD